MSTIENISLFIPKIFCNYTEKYIRDVFEKKHKIGKIHHFDIKQKLSADGEPYNSVYIHFQNWYTNEEAIDFHKSVLNPDVETKIYHDHENTWYWIVLKNNTRKFISGERKQRINIESCVVYCPPIDNSLFMSSFKIKKQKDDENEDIVKIEPVVKIEPLKSEVEIEDAEAQIEIDVELDKIDAIDNQIDNQIDYEMDYEMDYEIQQAIQEEENQFEFADNELNKYEVMQEEDNKHLRMIDMRYVETIERENVDLFAQICHLQDLLKIEQIKCDALAAILKPNNK